MAQAIIKTPSTNNLVLPLTNFGDLDEFFINVMTGSGWIKLSFMICVLSTYAGTNFVNLQLTADGIIIPNTLTCDLILQNVYKTVNIISMVRMGAGQHVFGVSASAVPANINIYGRTAAYILHELGY